MDVIGRALRVAARQVERAPSDAQKEAGNYAKGHLYAHGLAITLENPKGSTRSGKDKGGKPWSVKMPAHYGYVKGTEGKDGDQVDVYLGPDHTSKTVFIVDQINAESGKFDEHKALLDYPSKAAALADYEAAFSDGKGKNRIGAVSEMSVADFKSWLKGGDTKKPLALKRFATGGSVGGLAPDLPSGEPLADLVAQLQDLHTGRGHRQAVFVPAPSVRSFLGSKHPIVTGGVPLPNFDGKGGMLICRDKSTASQALVQRDMGTPMQAVIGYLTGNGLGKPADGTTAVQQVTPEGAVTRERLVRSPAVSDDMEQAQDEFAEPGRQVRVIPAEASIARRAEGVTQDAAQGFAGGGATSWRASAAPYGLQQLSSKLGIPVEQLISNPQIIAAAVAHMEDPRGANHVAESFMDMVDRNGGGRDGILKTVAGYDTMTMANGRHIGSLAGGDQNATINGLNVMSMQPTLEHLRGVMSGETPRILPEGYTQNFSPAAARVQPIRPGSWNYYKAPSGQSVYAPTWAAPAIQGGQYAMTPSGEYMVPSGAPFQVSWSKPSSAGASQPPMAVGAPPTPPVDANSPPLSPTPVPQSTPAPVPTTNAPPVVTPSPVPSTKSATWVEGPLGLMPKWSDGSTALQGYAGGGSPAFPGDESDFPSMVANNPQGWGSAPPLPVWQRDPLDFPGEVRNLADRPSDPIEAPIAESLSPTMGAYGAGQAAGETINALRDQDWGKAAEFGLPLAAMAVAPGMPKGVRGAVPRELNEAGFYSPSLEAAKGLPQESGTLQQMRSMLLNAGAKPKELEAVGFDTAFPDPAAKVSRGQIEEFLRGNRVGLGAKTFADRKTSLRVTEGRRGDFNIVDADGNLIDGPFNNQQEAQRHLGTSPVMGSESSASRFDQWSTPGGIPGSYREVVTTLPVNAEKLAQARGIFDGPAATPFDQQQPAFRREILSGLGEDTYTSSHWPGVTNPAWHRREKDFLNPDGSKTRVWDEFQADAQQGAHKADTGIRDPQVAAQLQSDLEKVQAEHADYDKQIKRIENDTIEMNLDPNMPFDIEKVLRYPADPRAKKLEAMREEIMALKAKRQDSGNRIMDLSNKVQAAKSTGLPEAYKPFYNTSDWLDPNLRQALSDAVKDPSVSRLAWAPGGVQGQRYSLTKVIDDLRYEPSLRQLSYRKAGDSSPHWFPLAEGIGPENIAEHVGKEVAEKLLAQKPANDGTLRLRGLNLETGGEGHKGFYGDFTPEGSYTPGIVGTRLLKILKGMDPDAKIEPHYVWASDLTKQQAIDEAIRYPAHISQERIGKGNVRYPSVTITPKMREAIKKGLPLFMAPAAFGMPDDGEDQE